MAGRLRGRVCRECPCEVVVQGDVAVCVHVGSDCGVLLEEARRAGPGVHVFVAPGRCRRVLEGFPDSVFVQMDVGSVLRDVARLPVRDEALRALAEQVASSVAGRVAEIVKRVAESRRAQVRVVAVEERRTADSGCARLLALVEEDAAVLSGASRSEWRERSRVLREVLGRKPRNVAEVEEAVARLNEALERCGAGVRLVVEGAHIRVLR